MDWVEFVGNTLMLAVALYVGRWMGRRDERRNTVAPDAVVEPPPPPEVQTYTVEVGRLETYTVRATSEAQAIDAAAAIVTRGKEPGRFIAVVGDRGTFIVRAPVIDNAATPESP